MLATTTPVKDLVDASLVAYARLFRFERDRQLQLQPIDQTSPISIILTVELSALQDALAVMLEGYDTFGRLAIREIGKQDGETRKP